MRFLDSLFIGLSAPEHPRARAATPGAALHYRAGHRRDAERYETYIGELEG